MSGKEGEPKKPIFEQIKDYILKEAKKNYGYLPFSARHFARIIDDAKKDFPIIYREVYVKNIEDNAKEIYEWFLKYIGDSS